MKLLELRNVSTAFESEGVRDSIRVLDGLSLSVDTGEILGLVGETGSGKSVTAATIMQLYRGAARVTDGEVLWNGRDLVGVSDAELQSQIRGREIAMIFQHPRAALNPLMTVGDQLAQVLRYRRGVARAQLRTESRRLLERVRIPDAGRRLSSYAHELSGGMAQRVMIALAVACRPKLLIADEPTTSLDVTTQVEIMSLLRELRDDIGTAIMLITHDLALASEFCERIAVIYSGRLVEEDSADRLLSCPQHPYTAALLRSRPQAGMRGELQTIPGEVPTFAQPPGGCRFHPRCDRSTQLCAEVRPVLTPRDGRLVACHHPGPIETLTIPAEQQSLGSVERRGRLGHMPAAVVLAAEGIAQRYPVKRGVWRRGSLWAVQDVSLEVREGETLGLVGETGCGKSTLGRILAGIEDPAGGTLDLLPAASSSAGRYGRARRRVQMVFQDPLASLNPRMRVGAAVAEAVRLNSDQRGEAVTGRVRELFEWVGLAPDHLRRYPHELSGGQQQRVSIARALACDPDIIVEDEPTSGLDVSVQAKLVNLLRRLQQERHLTQVFISHDLSVVEYLSDRVAVMYLGRIVEIGSVSQIFCEPGHPYTIALLSAAPSLLANGPSRRIELPGEVPSLIDTPPGCRLHTRCPMAVSRCKSEDQALKARGDGHAIACWRVTENEMNPADMAREMARER
jgi:peptide/nickel transport system ATP-binding protein